ncbi:hypothetical protein Tco_1234744 [Tanacetum coccineum]
MTEEETKNQKGIEELAKAEALRPQRKKWLKILNRRAKGKIINCDVFTRGKGPINLKVYRDDDTTEVIYNFKVSDFHVGEWKNVLEETLW